MSSLSCEKESLKKTIEYELEEHYRGTNIELLFRRLSDIDCQIEEKKITKTDYYVGEMKKDRYHGFGHFVDDNGSGYFGYWKNDGFFKKKTRGREDYFKKWNNIKEKWLSGYKNKNVAPGYSVKKTVKAEDEWCAEAYMETDYSLLSEGDFKKVIKNYVAFQFLAQD